ncbi:hypothetical protein VFPPC_15402 [Pochonia chlamydosporia 170]|uniref:Uncharacterized protein n=1 Tax=Pochonia chlamydosporia 170 TaxID=1380566 RepID=A0A179G8B5_METCM|nr:hypothetical protein VFPPC_15402 [Pochonia chlamydosporia 170]OAQ74046.1 hypothetical protein VFPPC_15402 [Pochonia chlamydosporia 170]
MDIPNCTRRAGHLILYNFDSILCSQEIGVILYAEPIPGMQVLALGYERLTLFFNEEVCFDSLFDEKFLILQWSFVGSVAEQIRWTGFLYEMGGHETEDEVFFVDIALDCTWIPSRAGNSILIGI